MTAHRKPCFPPSYDANRQDGNCKWCNEPLPRKKDGGISRSWFWHGPCGDVHGLMTDLTRQRHALLKRDGDLCADCGEPACGPSLEVDHVVPLWSVDREAPDAGKFWTLDNLQLLGQPCHKKKSAREAKRRGKEKRIRKKNEGRADVSSDLISLAPDDAASNPSEPPKARACGSPKRGPKIQSRGFQKAPSDYVHFPPGRKFARKGAGA